MKRAGLVAAAVYLVAAFVTFRSGVVPVRPMYEGFAPPPPYRWVSPPEDAATTQPPEKGSRQLAMTGTGNEQATMATGDGQAYVVFPKDAIAPKEGETSADATLSPVDSSKLPKAPKGYTIGGNAYAATMVYTASNERVRVVKDLQVVLQYPVHATTIFVQSGRRWEALSTKPYAQSMQVFGTTKTLGTFVAAGAGESAARPGVPWWTWLAVGGALVLAGFAGRTRRIRRRPVTRQARRRKQRRRER